MHAEPCCTVETGPSMASVSLPDTFFAAAPPFDMPFEAAQPCVKMGELCCMLSCGHTATAAAATMISGPERLHPGNSVDTAWFDRLVLNAGHCHMYVVHATHKPHARMATTTALLCCPTAAWNTRRVASSGANRAAIVWGHWPVPVVDSPGPGSPPQHSVEPPGPELQKNLRD